MDAAANIRKLLDAIHDKDYYRMKKLSEDFIREAAVTQDPVTIKLALISYALNKLYSKEYYHKDQVKWSEFNIDIRNLLRTARDSEAPAAVIEKAFDRIREFDESLGRFIQKLTNKAMVSKGATLYAIGLSLGLASQLTGATKWEIMRDTGQTRVIDEDKQKSDLRSRIKYARKVLG